MNLYKIFGEKKHINVARENYNPFERKKKQKPKKKKCDIAGIIVNFQFYCLFERFSYRNKSYRKYSTFLSLNGYETRIDCIAWPFVSISPQINRCKRFGCVDIEEAGWILRLNLEFCEWIYRHTHVHRTRIYRSIKSFQSTC